MNDAASSIGAPTIYSRRRLLLTLSAVASVAMLSWFEASGAGSARSSYVALVRQVEQMSRDTAAIQSLRQAPRLAAERERPNDELVSQINKALAGAEIPLEHWIAHDPAPAVRLPRTPYKQLSLRLSLENLSLRQLVAFAFQLVGQDASLSVYRLRLTLPRSGEKGRWNVEMTMAYLIYAPYAGAE